MGQLTPASAEDGARGGFYSLETLPYSAIDMMKVP
jgi:hypothetical protein